MPRTALLSCLAAVAAGLAPGAARARNYVWTTLDAPGLRDNNAVAVNAAGVVLGHGYSPAGMRVGWQYTAARGFETVPTPRPTHDDFPADINDIGQIVGGYTAGPRSSQSYLSTVAPPSTRKLGIAGSSSVSARALNDSGQVVGEYFLPGAFIQHGFLRAGATVTTLDPPDAIFTKPTAINDSGTVAGFYARADYRFHGFTYAAGVLSSFDVPRSVATYVNGLSPAGSVAGSYIDDANFRRHGFTRRGEGYRSYDVPDSNDTEALAALPDGQVIGRWVDRRGRFHGFNFLGGTYYSLTFPGADAYVTGVNRAGSLVGYYHDARGLAHGFVATCPATVPCQH